MKSVQIRSFFWSVISCIRTEYSVHKSPYSVWIQENTDQKKLRISTLFTQCKKCVAGKALLKTQILNLNDKNLHENPFEILVEDMATAAPSFNVIEEGKDGDIM